MAQKHREGKLMPMSLGYNERQPFIISNCLNTFFSFGIMASLWIRSAQITVVISIQYERPKTYNWTLNELRTRFLNSLNVHILVSFFSDRLVNVRFCSKYLSGRYYTIIFLYGWYKDGSLLSCLVRTWAIRYLYDCPTF